MRCGARRRSGRGPRRSDRHGVELVGGAVAVDAGSSFGMRSPPISEVSPLVTAPRVDAIDPHPRGVAAMPERTLVVAATNLLARGFLVVPTDRAVARRRSGERAVRGRARDPARRCVQGAGARAWPWSTRAPRRAWPPMLRPSSRRCRRCCGAGLRVVEAADELHLVAVRARRARRRRRRRSSSASTSASRSS